MILPEELEEAELELELEEEDGVYNKEMDNCIRSSGILYARLFESGE